MTLTSNYVAKCGDNSNRISELFRACSRIWWCQVLRLRGFDDMRSRCMLKTMLPPPHDLAQANSDEITQLRTEIHSLHAQTTNILNHIISALSSLSQSHTKTRTHCTGDSTHPEQRNIPKVHAHVPFEGINEINPSHAPSPLSPSEIEPELRLQNYTQDKDGFSSDFRRPDVDGHHLTALHRVVSTAASNGAEYSLDPPSARKRIYSHAVDGPHDAYCHQDKRRRTTGEEYITSGAFGSIPMQHVRILREMFKDPRAMFRSTDQHAVLSSLLERKTHVLHVCKTGGGKTLAFQMAMKMWPSKVKGVIVVPYVVLYQEMKRKLSSIGIPTQICSGSGEILLDPHARVFVVGIDTFASPKFYSQVKQLAELSQLGAILLDEVDALVTDGDFRPQFLEAYEHALLLPNTVLLFISATIPAPFENEWLEKLSLRGSSQPGRPDAIDSCAPLQAGKQNPAFFIIRNRSTDRFNIAYAVEPYGVDRKGEGLKKKVSELANRGSHTIVYVVKQDTVHELGQYLSTPWKIHGRMNQSDRTNGTDGFGKGDKSVLVGNKAAYYGMDVPNVDAVIIVIEVCPASHFSGVKIGH